MGSMIALEAAAQLGERASALVMVGTAYPMKVSPALLEASRTRVLEAIDMVNALSQSTHAARPSCPGRASASMAATARSCAACSRAGRQATSSCTTLRLRRLRRAGTGRAGLALPRHARGGRATR
jgi:pimeloyl-ACP methyl ester carboxylesterase